MEHCLFSFDSVAACCLVSAQLSFLIVWFGAQYSECPFSLSCWI